MSCRRLRSLAAFTLVELLAVVLILGVLLAILVPTFLNSREGAEDASAGAEVVTAYHRAKAYWVDKEQFPATADLVERLGADEPSLAVTAAASLNTSQAPQGGDVAVYSDADQSVAFTKLSDSGTVIYLVENNGIATANFPVPGIAAEIGGAGGGGTPEPPAPEIIGTFDTAFHSNVGSGASGAIYVASVQSDQKILLGGAFTTWAGTTVNRIVRLNADGSKDTGFSTGTGTNSEGPFAIATQSDGKVIVGGAFTSWNGTSANNIVRLNSDGTRDGSFTPGAGPNNWVRSIAVQSDGRIIVAGTFTSWSGTAANNIVRLNSDGTRDGSFTVGTGANDGIYGLVLQPDGKIIATGTFTSWNGTTANGIVRLNSDGTRDTSFATGTAADDAIWAVALQSDGKVVVGGGFLNWDGSAAKHIVRLNSDGTRDVAFTTGGGPNDSINGQIAIQPDGKIVVGGIFTKWGGETVNYIVRLNTDGSRDTSFTSNAGTGANSTVGVVAIQGAALILAGDFTTWNGTTVGRIARLT